MQLKEIAKLKKKMSQACNKAINEIISQIIANEDQHKASLGDPDATFQATSLNIKFELNLEDKSNRAKPFKMYCNPIVDLK